MDSVIEQRQHPSAPQKNAGSIKVHTFGCKINLYDSGWLTNSLRDVRSNEKVHVLNTCAVTAEATKEAGRLVRKLKAADPFCKVVVTGCAAQVDTDKFNVIGGADLVVANSHKSQLAEIIDDHLKGRSSVRVFKSNIFKKEDPEIDGGLNEGRTRSFLKIQDGCNSFCTFCVIPFARGKSRSLSIDHLVTKVTQLHDRGYHEVILTGVHIGDYVDESQGAARGLEDLVEALLKETSVPRIRLSSLEPIEVTDRLLELYRDDRLCPHFHMSIQSATTKVLAAMKRQYSADEVETALQAIERRVPGAFVGMDVIAGFPNETEIDFTETYLRLANLPWTRIHVFPYSPRPGTWADKTMPILDRSVIKARAAKLRDLSDARYAKAAQLQIGKVKSILPLPPKAPKKAASGNQVMGLSRDNWNVEFNHSKNANDPSTSVSVRVIGVAQNSTQQRISLSGEPLL